MVGDAKGDTDREVEPEPADPREGVWCWRGLGLEKESSLCWLDSTGMTSGFMAGSGDFVNTGGGGGGAGGMLLTTEGGGVVSLNASGSDGFGAGAGGMLLMAGAGPWAGDGGWLLLSRGLPSGPVIRCMLMVEVVRMGMLGIWYPRPPP